jgi:hypothetical protein
MPVVQAYDSGSTPSLPADVWNTYRIGSAPATGPLRILIEITLDSTPDPNWNLWGWACVEVLSQSIQPVLMAPVGIQSPGAAPPSTGSTRRVGIPQELPRTPGLLPTDRETAFRAVHWNINRWCGVHRARVLFMT